MRGTGPLCWNHASKLPHFRFQLQVSAHGQNTTLSSLPVFSLLDVLLVLHHCGSTAFLRWLTNIKSIFFFFCSVVPACHLLAKWSIHQRAPRKRVHPYHCKRFIHASSHLQRFSSFFLLFLIIAVQNKVRKKLVTIMTSIEFFAEIVSKHRKNREVIIGCLF